LARHSQPESCVAVARQVEPVLIARQSRCLAGSEHLIQVAFLGLEELHRGRDRPVGQVAHRDGGASPQIAPAGQHPSVVDIQSAPDSVPELGYLLASPDGGSASTRSLRRRSRPICSWEAWKPMTRTATLPPALRVWAPVSGASLAKSPRWPPRSGPGLPRGGSGPHLRARASVLPSPGAAS
jgi:hypothetical protein